MPRRTVKLKGRAADLISAFDVKLGRFEHSGHQYRGRTGAIYLPADLAPHIEVVLGLDDRPQATPQFRVRPRASASNISYTPRQVAELYQFPLDADGTGQTVGILELGGGYKTADFAGLFFVSRLACAGRDCGPGGRRQKFAEQREQRGWRGAARHRSGRRGCAASKDRCLFRHKHITGISGRLDDRNSRHLRTILR